MPNLDLQNKKVTKLNDESSLKGTLIAVFLLGFFIIASWLGVYYLFLERL